MATWIEDEEVQVPLNEGETLIEDDGVAQALEPETDDVQEAQSGEHSEEELPEKYRGKSAADIARMHQEAEKALGRQGNEIGELRKVFDDFVQTSARSNQEPQQAAPEEVDYFVDPKTAVDRQIQNHPVLQQAQAVAVEMQKAQGVAQLQSKHADLKEVLSSQEFGEWVQASPVRQRLYMEADQGMSVQAADELLSTFKQIRRTAQTSQNVSAQARKTALQGANTGSSRNNPDGQRSGRIFSRPQIRRLMKNDPEQYEAMQDQIMAAYAEGRVRG